MKSIKEIALELKSANVEEFKVLKENLKDDTRKGVIKELQKREKQFEKLNKMINEYKNRQRYEIELFKNGYKLIAGLDEVGRGPLAGPVYAAAVILDPKSSYLEVRDSKRLSEDKRIELDKKIKDTALSYCIASATHEEIDKLNILNATKLAMKRAVEGLKLNPDYLLLDAITINVNLPQKSIIKGDDNSISIGAASIIAKVARDEYMKEMAKKYPGYDFESNKGYGTKKHLEGIDTKGLCEIHRKSFVKNILGEK